MQNSRTNQSEILCQHCGKKIIASNFLLHEARCQIMFSRVRREQPNFNEEKIPNNSFMNNGKKEFKQERNPSSLYRRQSEQERKKIFNSSYKREEEQRIPCTNCGYMQTLLELDTHPNECPYSGKPCTFCGQSFPQNLMEQHQQVCSARIPPNYGNHIHEEGPRHQFPQDLEIQSDQEEQRIHPQGNFAFLFGNNRYPAIHSVFRRIENTNGRLVIEESDGQGNFTRTIREQQPNFPNSGRQDFFGGRRGSPFDFFRLLQLLALRSGGAVQQGLTKQELKKLTKIKYKPNSNSTEKDLCTICYCQFQQDERIIQLKCKHMYHEQCIIKWLQKNAKCPVCKTPQTNRPIHREDE